jgi:hypothetical protein
LVLATTPATIRQEANIMAQYKLEIKSARGKVEIKDTNRKDDTAAHVFGRAIIKSKAKGTTLVVRNGKKVVTTFKSLGNGDYTATRNA